ncbi:MULTISPECIES: hypothetical protein [Olivibacter]|uniref:Glycosyl hydrolase n=1 Tax=Olivibacter jilunii TaxID=985016 RepID=A0ABW6BCV9_9SPHI|nr:hypothetical protein [Olivibacter sp. UJ_SKK_5.1]
MHKFAFGAVSSWTENRPTVSANYSNSVPLNKQLDIIQHEMGGNAVRIGVNTTNSGSADKPGYGMLQAAVEQVLAETVARNMRLIILLIDQSHQFMGDAWRNNDIDLGLTQSELDALLPQAEMSGYNMTAGFLNLNNTLLNNGLHVLELGNEPELFRNIQKDNTSGVNQSHFWPQKVAVTKAYFKGMHDAAKALRPNLKISTPASMGWCPVWLYSQYLSVMPNVDYISWHWYDEMERNMDRGNWPDGLYGSIFEYLYAKWGKRIIISECNARGIGFNNANDGPESGDLHQDKQVAFFSSFLPKAVASGHVDIITTYKLLSEPYQTNSIESTFGVNYFPGIDTSIPPAQQNFSNIVPKKVMKLFKYLTR